MERDQSSGSGPAHAIARRKRTVLAEPRGFCAGVVRAIAMVEKSLEIHGPPVYVRKEIVHNQYVVASLQRRGARFVDSESDVPEGAVCVFSAHGVSPLVRDNAGARGLRVIDATCPLVSRVHQHARRGARDGRLVLLIGHADHEETQGTYGEAPDRTIVIDTVDDVDRTGLPADTPVTYLTQTTLSVDETAEVIDRIKARFTDVVAPGTDTICYASQNRQNGIKSLASRCDLILVVGARNSSNSLRMVDVARETGTRAHLVPDAADFDETWLKDVWTVGVSSGASVPEILVERLIDRLARLGYDDISTDVTSVEDVNFAVPSFLTTTTAAPPDLVATEATEIAHTPDTPADRSARPDHHRPYQRQGGEDDDRRRT
ncbi:4-hydroxy-3-methylbut-2-enyl diphosphate reductase [Actinoplanes sp. NEAU-H7]|uniref:4-hydroxy-3-methylbut-2-enyl diphosphate reductase n=1 Tax=Actinoplanes flavus TaxID=2820290 RepID=A0ABS3URC8_9ACTN|nr:4-hydroxy-3-methylbut-2-enyl diphosphate reductase [Actinoplanes flavus]MBO3741343.1 4-hydroxy-3-methylbut-2-enyl diphosphate reductase [Actinoplanes flavus]